MKSTVSCKDLNELTDACTLHACVKMMNGTPSVYGDTSERWFIYFKNETKYNGESIKGALVKWWIDPSTIDDHSKSTLIGDPMKGISEPQISLTNFLALNYEMDMYRYIIKPLTDYNVCPNLPTLLVTSKGCHINNFARIMMNSDPKMSLEAIKYVIKLSVTLMANGTPHDGLWGFNEWEREFAEKKGYFSKEKNVQVKSYWRYNMIVFKEDLFDNLVTKPLSKVWGDVMYEDIESPIIFQIVTACYAMSAAGIVHIRPLDECVRLTDTLNTPVHIHYVYGDTLYTVKTLQRVFYCGFHWSFSIALGDNPLFSNSESMKIHNDFIPNKGIIICLGIIAKVWIDYNGTMTDMIYDILCPNEKAKTYLKENVKTQYWDSTLTKLNGEPLGKDDYSMFRTMDEMLKKAATYSPYVKTKSAKNLPKEFLSQPNVYVCNPSMFERGRLKKYDIRKESSPK